VCFVLGYVYAGYIITSIGVESCSPLFYELACESTYPIAEGVTNGLLTWLNNVVGLTFLFVLMRPNIGQYSTALCSISLSELRYGSGLGFMVRFVISVSGLGSVRSGVRVCVSV